MNVKQISVFLENRPGSLREFTALLKENDINMRALCLAEVPEFGVARVIVDDPYELANVLKNEGYVFKATPVIAVAIEDKPGSLVKILSVLEEAGMNLEYSYAFITKTIGEAYIIIRVDDAEAGARALGDAGIKVLCTEDLEKL